jgi:multidrug efflux pump subunit AcrA (membrane-fusion protein)
LKAKADLKQAEANSRAANADLKLKEVLIEVARKDRDRAQTLADYAKLTAPFDGVIVERKVDPGDFVQNATTGQSEPLLTVARVDVVTVVMKVPDNFAPYVAKDTEAVLQVGDLVIEGKVTRYSPSIQKSEGRTMHVEVDLFNSTSKKEYDDWVSKQQQVWAEERKGKDASLPLFPRTTGKRLRDRTQLLLPGMTGRMRLLLRRFENVYLIPSDAVFARGGKTYIAEVKDGTAHLLPVEVEADDGKLAKVAVVLHDVTARGGEHELFKDLTGEEQIITSGLSEISDGQAVKAVLANW